MARDDMPARMKRFLAHPPARISPHVVKVRKGQTPRKPLRGLVSKLARQQDGKCHYCKVRIVAKRPRGGERLSTVDHFIPLSRGGTNDIGNLVAACYDCNQRKANKLPDEFWRELNGTARGSKPDRVETGTGSIEDESRARQGLAQALPNTSCEGPSS